MCYEVMSLLEDRHCCHCLGPLLNVNFLGDKGLRSVLMIPIPLRSEYNTTDFQSTKTIEDFILLSACSLQLCWCGYLTVLGCVN